MIASKSDKAYLVTDTKFESAPLLNSILFGVIAFIVYRLVFDLVEYAIINNRDIKKLKKSFDQVKESNENYSSYIYLKFAFVHMSFLIPILSFIAAILIKDGQTFFNISKCWFVILNFIFLLVGAGNYYFLFKIVNYTEPEG